MVIKLKVHQNEPLLCLISRITSPLICFHLYNSMAHSSPFGMDYIKTDKELNSPDLRYLYCQPDRAILLSKQGLFIIPFVKAL